MDETLLDNLEPPRFETRPALLIAGIGERYTANASTSIPAQWERFGPHIGHTPGQIGNASYGVVSSSDAEGNIEYICGVEVADFTGIPQDWSRIDIPEQNYAVFTQRDHISTIKSVWFTIFNQWLPESEHETADSPSFERYDERYDPATGNGGFEIWIPIEK